MLELDSGLKKKNDKYLGKAKSTVKVPSSIVNVAVDGVVYNFDKLYTYMVPVELNDKISLGQRVLVPFGKGNKKRVALVLDIKNYVNNDYYHKVDGVDEGIDAMPYFTDNNFSIKPILEIIDVKSIVSVEMIGIIKWLKAHTFCTYFEAFKVTVPSGINIMLGSRYSLSNKLTEEIYEKLSPVEKLLIEEISKNKDYFNEMNIYHENKSADSVLKKLVQDGLVVEENLFKRKIKDQRSVMVKLSEDILEQQIENSYKFTSKQRKVIDMLLNIEAASLKEVVYLCSVSKVVLDNLEKKGILEYFEIDTYRTPYQSSNTSIDVLINNISLNNEQQEALKAFIEMSNQNKFSVSLLNGVTGSGKTFVLIKLMEYVMSQGKNIIIMVPEISLTPQLIELLHNYFGDCLGVLHSGLTLAQRLDEWKRINGGNVKIVLGTRSAIFAPLENIGLIILDEEQESTYKSDQSPRYHTKEVAKLRALHHNSLLLMVSATPSVETYYKMKKNNVTILKINKRFNNTELPQVNIVDMSKENIDNNSPFSRKLILEIEEDLKLGKQSILLMNRRGYNTVVKCNECGRVEHCPNCSIALIYHKASESLICHYCGYTKDVVKSCGQCGSVYMQYGGIGTQKVEKQLSEIFPKAKILRMDSDTTSARFAYDKYFKQFSNHDYDILIGTQMISKGLNFPNVATVGIIDADQSLYDNNFKASERTFSLITQVIGRCGRGTDRGRAIIQTYCPDNEIFRFAALQDYEGFYKQEIESRRFLLYPPFCDMSMIGFSGSEEYKVKRAAQEFFEILKEIVLEKYNSIPLKMLSPTSDDIAKINNKYRYKIILKHRDTAKYRAMIDEALLKTGMNKSFRSVKIFVDKLVSV